MAQCTYIDGIASSQAIDTAGEVVDLKGLDCSSLLGAALNWEHKSDTPAQVVGKILEFKKIFDEKDCENERQLYYWHKCGIPYLYILGRLFDDKKDSSKEAAALFLDDAQNPSEPKMVGFSVEGSKIPGAKEGMVLTRSIARKVTITTMPANKTCVAEMIPSPHTKKDDFESIFKTESTQVEFFNPNSNLLELLQKKEENMDKSEELADLHKALPSGWKAGITRHSQLGQIASLSHPQHGIVTIHKNPETGNHEVKHSGALAGVQGQKGVFSNPKDAFAHASKYVGAVHSGKVLPKTSVNMPSSSKLPHSAPGEKHVPNLHKALEAGMGNVAPGQLAGGASLISESLGGKKKKQKKDGETSHVSMSVMSVSGGTGMGGMGGMGKAEKLEKDDSHKFLGATHPSQFKPGKKYGTKQMVYHGSTDTHHNFKHGDRDVKIPRTPPLLKSDWLARAEDAYSRWEKREEFKSFMKKSMPHMAKGEIDAIGQVIALKKSIEAEESLVKMFSSYFIKEEPQKE